MSKMNNNLDGKVARQLMALVLDVTDSQEIMRTSVEAETAIQAQRTLATAILQVTENAKTVEELIHYEMVLQRLDRPQAKTDRDKTSIANAEQDYHQLVETVEQMRKSPEAYFKANLSIRETGGDFKKMPRSRGLQQISANKARMQNRASFAPDEQGAVWEARGVLADKTAGMLRTLHDNLVKNHERRLRIEERQVKRDNRSKGIEP